MQGATPVGIQQVAMARDAKEKHTKTKKFSQKLVKRPGVFGSHCNCFPVRDLESDLKRIQDLIFGFGRGTRHSSFSRFLASVHPLIPIVVGDVYFDHMLGPSKYYALVFFSFAGTTHNLPKEVSLAVVMAR